MDSGRRSDTPVRSGRRAVLAGVAGAVPLAGCLTLDGDDGGVTDDAEGSDPEPPFEVRTIDAPGSEAGTITIPTPETATVCNFTRTACPTSEGQLSVIANARDGVESDRVRFCSIIEFGRDPTEDDAAFAEWWAEHDGDWTLAIDDDRAVFGYYDVDTTPETAVIGGDGTVYLQDSGASAGDIARAADEAAAAADDEPAATADDDG